MPTAGELSKSSIDITEKYDTLTNKYRIVIIGMEIIIAKGIFLLKQKSNKFVLLSIHFN